VANTWVGALVGAIPPLMGWAAASGNLEAGSAVLALALFSWQMPHFLSLAWFCKDDYIRGGFQMLSRIDPQVRACLIEVGNLGPTCGKGEDKEDDECGKWEVWGLAGLLAAPAAACLTSLINAASGPPRPLLLPPRRASAPPLPCCGTAPT
jgi:hypothetical protein